MEVVPGAGGQEASLFAEEIFNFYINYCQDQGCDIEVVEETKNILNKNSKAVTSSGITKVKYENRCMYALETLKMKKVLLYK